MNKLDELKALCEAATPGPWGLVLFPDEPNVIAVDLGDGRLAWKALNLFENELRLVVAARTYLPKLIAVAEAAKDLAEITDKYATALYIGSPGTYSLEKDDQAARTKFEAALTAMESE